MPKRGSKPTLTIREETEQDRGEWKLFMEYYATLKGTVARPPKKQKIIRSGTSRNPAPR